MKKNLTKISILLLSFPLLAVDVSNPAPGLFSTAFGTSFSEIILEVIKKLLLLVGVIAMAYIIYGGFRIATAGGNDETVKQGRKTLTNAIIGLVVIILSYLIVNITVNAVFGNVK